MKKYILLPCLFSVFTLSAQHIGAGIGMANYMGDVNPPKGGNTYAWNRVQFLSLEKSILNDKCDVGLGFMYGNVGFSDYNVHTAYNFRTQLGQAEARLRYFLMPATMNARLFVEAGVAMTGYKTFYDLQDENGNLYHYWTDGSIRDKIQIPENQQTAKMISRDYVYETFSGNQGTALAFPIGLGAMLKTGNKTAVNFFMRYVPFMSDAIDSYDFSSRNDRLFLLGATFVYRFDKRTILYEENKDYKNVNHKAISSEDTDGDGVEDFLDICPGTPKNVQVDKKGCPIDTDKDGVPDYLDEEPHTLPGVQVDAKGRQLNEDVMLIRSLLYEGNFSEALTHFNKVQHTLPESHQKELKKQLNISED